MFFPGILRSMSEAIKDGEANSAVEKRPDSPNTSVFVEECLEKTAKRVCECPSWQLFRGDGCTCGGT